jgi:hypothetical protein
MLLSLAHCWREPRGGPLIGVPVPSVPSALQASHCPVHAFVQHTPSTQIPERHSPGVLQETPASFCGEQTPPAQ